MSTQTANEKANAKAVAKFLGKSQEKAVVMTPTGAQALSTKNAAMDPAAVRLYDIAKVWSAGNELSPLSIVDFVTTLMRTLEDIVQEKGQGQRKKQILLTVLRLVIENDAKVSEEMKRTLLSTLQLTVPPLIDTLVGIARGDIDIHKRWNNLFGGCCPCPGPKPTKK